MHDQSFKNLILDYPRAALELFAPAEARDLPADASFRPFRQELAKRRLKDGFRATDAPLLVECPGRQRSAILFLVEEETEAARFSWLRLAQYALGAAELAKTLRVVPAVVALRGALPDGPFGLGTERETYLAFRFHACSLATLLAEEWFGSDNIVARLNLPNMAHPPGLRLRVYRHALEGLLALEPDHDRRLKYRDFIDQYARLSEAEQLEFREQELAMSDRRDEMISMWEAERRRGLAEGRQEGRREGLLEGRTAGLAQALLQILQVRGLEVSDEHRARIGACSDPEVLESWLRAAVVTSSTDQLLASTH